MTSRTPAKEPVPWKHGVMSTPLLTSAWIYAAGAVEHIPVDLGHQPFDWRFVAVGGTTGVIGAAAARFKRTGSWVKTAFTAAWLSGTTAWLTYAAHTTPWSLRSVEVLAAATAVFTPLYAIDRHARRDQIAEQWAVEKAAQSAKPGDWELLMQRAGLNGVTVAAQEATRGGYILHLKFSPDGSGGEDFTPQVLRKLERAKGDLRIGALRYVLCEYAVDGQLHVSTLNALAQTLPLPDEAHPITINEPITLGMLESGEPIEILFRQNSIFLVGMRGSGKSVTLQVIISLLTRCVDCVIWMIDLAGGNTAKRWLVPWLQRWEGCDRPVLDWVAVTEAEALRMLNAAHAVADDRAMTMRGGKVKPSPQMPAIYLITDENSDLMAWSMKAAEPKTRLIKKGRKAAVDVIDAVQRGTGPNSGGGEITSQYDSVIGMKVNRKSETQFVFPDHYATINLANLPGKGATFLKLPTWQQPQPGKFYFVDDDEDRDDIEKLAAARTNIRPDLDQRAQQIAERFGYADRWSDPERIGWLLDAYGLGGAGHKTPPAAAATITRLAPIRPVEDYLAHARTSHAQAEEDEEPVPGADQLIAELEAELARAATPEDAKPDERPEREDPRRGDVRRLVEEAGPEGIKVDALLRALEQHLGDRTPARGVVQRWLRQDVNEQRLWQPATGFYAIRPSKEN